MRKQQWILALSGIALLMFLYFFGNTVAPDKKITAGTPGSAAAVDTAEALTSEDVIAKYKASLDTGQVQKLVQLENAVVRGDVRNQQMHVYHQLASYWADTLHNEVMGAYYTGEAAKLENSEKNLTFAAHLLLDDMMSSTDATLQRWLATQAKALFDKALVINPNNDSSKIGVGVCYMFGNIADNPMQGILAIREIADKDPDNLYAQMMLGLGGIQSGQYDKAAERFLTVVKKQPGNIEAILNLASIYEHSGNKTEAAKWYKNALNYIQVPQARKEIEERIKSLQ
ncbi:tetratricopeptide repeat protein [Parafilimonas sp.]|uniref:tetratricopeptide repeat protein n=1 Tax=Parafilimonas sp. TaxID=1969739 RepID=UPI0039E2DFCD